MIEYRIIPMETYPRRKHFAYFQKMAQPYAGLTVSVEITRFLQKVREMGSPFFLSFLYCISRAANGVPELRQRILGENIVEYANCPTSHTEALPTAPTATVCWTVASPFLPTFLRRSGPRQRRAPRETWKTGRMPCPSSSSPLCTGSLMRPFFSPHPSQLTPTPALPGAGTGGKGSGFFFQSPSSATMLW